MANMIPISTVVVGSGGATSIQFTNISQNYTDLIVKGSSRDSAPSGGAAVVKIQLNGSTSNFTGRYIYATGSSVGSLTDQPRMVGNAPGGSYTLNTFSNYEFYIPNYTSSNYKSISADIVAERNATTTDMDLSALLWSNTAPITSITLTTDVDFTQYSSATLYGIRKY